MIEFDTFVVATRPGIDTDRLDDIKQTVSEICDFAKEYSIEILEDANDADEKTLFIALGGDGTFLNAARQAIQADWR